MFIVIVYFLPGKSLMHTSGDTVFSFVVLTSGQLGC